MGSSVGSNISYEWIIQIQVMTGYGKTFEKMNANVGMVSLLEVWMITMEYWNINSGRKLDLVLILSLLVRHRRGG